MLTWSPKNSSRKTKLMENLGISSTVSYEKKKEKETLEHSVLNVMLLSSPNLKTQGSVQNRRQKDFEIQRW